MNWEWDNTLEEILPDTARIDAFLKQLLPGQPIHIVDMMQEILQGAYDILEIYPYLYIGIYNGVEEIIYFHTGVIYSLLCHYIFFRCLSEYRRSTDGRISFPVMSTCGSDYCIAGDQEYRDADYGAYAGISQACDSILYDLHCGSRFWFIRFRIL